MTARSRSKAAPLNLRVSSVERLGEAEVQAAVKDRRHDPGDGSPDDRQVSQNMTVPGYRHPTGAEPDQRIGHKPVGDKGS
jgi:hypothetical protein